MQINYNILLTLDEKTLEQGLFSIYKNAKELNISADILAKENKYAMATALKLLAIEELIKAQSVFLFIVGVKNKEFINYGFKAISGHSNVHQTRLKVAAIFNAMKNALNPKNIEDKFKSIIAKNPEKFELIEGEILENFINRVTANMPSVKEIIETEDLLNEGRLDQILENSHNWLSDAQKIKEKCMYVDIERNKWTTPLDININDYEAAQKNTEEVFSGITSIIEKLMTDSEIGKKATLLTLKNIFKPLYSEE